METPDEQTQIRKFLVDVFMFMDRTVEFTHRPLSSENRWLSKDAPIVQVIFPEDVTSLRPIDALFVTAYGHNQVFQRSSFVDAAVAVLQIIKEADIPESILTYVDQLVESYVAKPEQPGVVSTEDWDPPLTQKEERGSRGWK